MKKVRDRLEKMLALIVNVILMALLKQGNVRVKYVAIVIPEVKKIKIPKKAGSLAISRETKPRIELYKFKVRYIVKTALIKLSNRREGGLQRERKRSL